MKMAPIPPVQRWLSALAPGNLRDTLNRHSRIVNLVALLVILLVIADIAGWFGVAEQWLTSQGHSQRPPGPPQHNVYVRVLHCPVRFITAMISDGGGGAWIAGEDSGICHYQPDAGVHWTYYDKANSPGLVSNHIYALCLDAENRLWVGTDRHGVCVFNGVKWQHYGLLNGPLGSHVTAIVSDPYDKSVWMCTEAGVSIYETGKHTWRYLPQAIPGKPDYFTANGLPPNPDSVAFNPQGVAFVGTQCNGLAIGYPPYNSWWMVKGPWKVPITPFGKGLPSNLINAVAAGKHGRIYVATDEGLAWNNRKNPFAFQYERGADYAMKDKQLWHPPRGFKMPPRKFLNRLLPGDHINCVAVDQQGKLWLGTWHSCLWTNALWSGRVQGGIREVTSTIVRYDARRRYRTQILARWRQAKQRQARTRKAGKVGAAEVLHAAVALPRIPPPLPGRSRFQADRYYVSAILPLADGQVLIGHYGAGISEARLSRPGWWAGLADKMACWWRGAWGYPPANDPALLPAPAKAPTARQLAALYQDLLNNNIPSRRAGTGPQVVPITDDWRTQGSWLGRYGRYWACLFACCSSPPDFVWSPASATLDHYEQIGPHHANGDSVRFFVTWLATKKERVLELPEIYLDSRVLMHLTMWDVDRRESEIDDHGERYPTTWQGPDLYVYLHIPPGAYTLSLYFFNKDGHSQKNRNRDYLVSMLPLPESHHFDKLFSLDTASLAKMRGTAQSRVVNFWGGVWKRFIVCGPMKLTIRVAKNYSYNTILQAAMLDPLSPHPAPYYYGRLAWQAHEKQSRKFRTKLVAAWQSGQLPDDPPARARDGGLATARQIIQILNVLEHRDPAVWAANQRFVYSAILRWCVAKYGAGLPTSRAAGIAEKCYYRLDLFRRWEALEKSQGIPTSRQIEKGLRWDRWRDSYRGLEFRTIRNYLKGVTAAKVAATAKR